jgi:hypothetical protein
MERGSQGRLWLVWFPCLPRGRTYPAITIAQEEQEGDGVRVRGTDMPETLPQFSIPVQKN